MSNINNEIIKANLQIEEVLVQIKEASNEQVLNDMIRMYNNLLNYKMDLVKKRMIDMDK
jgi:hypothetical protein